jgi:hypothetical protein
MKNKIYIDNLLEIINPSKNNTDFCDGLQSSCDNFPNQKLESHIRNLLVILFNKNFNNEYRALAEYPRFNDGNKRVCIDFSVCRNKLVDFTMEMKYNFSNDHNQFRNFGNIINKDFVNRKWSVSHGIDAFMLVVCDTNKKSFYDLEQDFEPPLNSLSQYQIADGKRNNWKANLESQFNTFKNDSVEFVKPKPITIKTKDKLELNFNFYFLYRK